MKKSLRLFGLFFALLAPVSARASELHETLAAPWQLGFPKPASPVMEQLVWLHNDFLLYIITVISVFVLVLMVVIAVKFNRKANPVPSKTAHNTMLEIVWTVIPIFILLVIAIPSLRAHYFIEDESGAEMTLKVLGYQWYWHYEYPDHGGFGFDSYMKKENELGPDEHRLLAVDNHVVVPVDTKIHVLMTGADVIHAWAIPALGVKRDAVPGRLNESWFTATKTGRFYGQCSELCGVGHGFMPIVMDVVSKEEFAQWVAAKQKEAGVTPVNSEASAQKAERPVVAPASAEHKNPVPVMEKEKALSKPDASDNRPSSDAKETDSRLKGKDNQPEPAGAAPKKN
jgi:cytochrome c oxidase subunit II